MEGLIRQGDILLTPVAALPNFIENHKNHCRVKRQKGEGIIVAAGEATGHHHRIRTKSVVMYRDGATRYIRVPKGGAELTHEEHETLTVPAGVYNFLRVPPTTGTAKAAVAWTFDKPTTKFEFAAQS